MNNIKYKKILFALIVLGTMSISGCKKWYDIPSDLDYLSERADYNTTSFSPVLGRTTLFSGIFNPDNSTLPMKFEIMNFRSADGTPSAILDHKFPTYVWRDDYTGKEKSLEEINAKRALEDHAPFEVRSSGEFIMWASANEGNLPGYQRGGGDTLSVTDSTMAKGYLFDVKVSNNGGERLIKDFELHPYHQRVYEPTDMDPVSGKVISQINPSISGLVGASSGNDLSNSASDTALRDVSVTFDKVGDGSSLMFQFVDKDNKLINPSSFNRTNWDSLVHGFNMKLTSEYVKYDVAYPIPLVKLPTVYTTSDGSQAAIKIAYDRLGFNGVRRTASISFSFNLFQQGDWVITFHFRRERPKFEDD